MGDGFWSAAGEQGEYYGIPGQGCWYRRNGGPAYWVTGGVHQLYSQTGYEGGPLGLPTSNFDSDRGVQTFEGGAIWWDGGKFTMGVEAKDGTFTPNGRSFEMAAPPAPPS